MLGNRYIRLAALLFLAMPASRAARGQGYAAESESYGMRAAVFGSAGAPMSGVSYDIDGTLGQAHPVGKVSGAAYELYAGFWEWIQPVPTGADETPLVFRLSQNYPNPFNPATTIEYSLPGKAKVDLTVYDVAGRRVRTLVREEQLPGAYSVIWDGRNEYGRQVASGIYFYRLDTGKSRRVRKMVILR